MTKETAKLIHPLCDPEFKGGKIVFKDNGKERTFASCVNIMTGDRLSWFDNEPPTVGLSQAWVTRVFTDIRKLHEVVSCIGDF